MMLASHQPDFFPYMGYFYKMFQSDIFVFSDNVQYSKKGRHNYNEILTTNGPMRLTLPIHYHADALNKIGIAANDRWVSKTLKTIWAEYKKAAYFHEVFPVMEELLANALIAKNLAEFNFTCISCIAKKLGLHKQTLLLSSQLELKKHKDARIIEMCKLLKADSYISGEGARDYHIEADYQENGIQLRYSDYKAIIYPQLTHSFTENMSVIDYAMNCGFTLPQKWRRWKR